MEPVKVRWVEGMQFIGTAESGHGVIMDSGKADGSGDSGPRPTELLLMALGGCTGMDVVHVLRKSRIAVDRFEMRVTGERAQEHPRKFVRVEIEFLFWGDNIPEERVERAIALSRDKYCSVGATVAGSTEIVTRFKIFPSSALSAGS